MYKLLLCRTARLLGIAMVFLLSVAIVHAQIKKGKSRALKTAQWMKGVMKPHCGDLKKGLEAGPANEEAWDALSVNASVLNEASYLLMDDGRCPDAVWAEAASKILRQSSADVLKAIEAKDLTAAKTAFGNLTKACSKCHDAHREKEKK